jgi:predicted metal-dependent phosphoesterase TrpH
MQLKCALHAHSGEDPEDQLPYSVFELIDQAQKNHFDVLALTLHNHFFYNKKIQEYAKQKGVLLIPGIEIDILDRHVVILGANKNCEKIRTFSDLKKWKNKNPDSFILAPHPYFPFFPPQSLGKYLEQNLDCFDGIELSFFYTGWINFNRKAKKIARKNNLPLIATSDCHVLEYLNIGYCTVKCAKKNEKSILHSLRKNESKNHSKPSSLLKLLRIYVKMLLGK